MRCTIAYISSCLHVGLVYFQPFCCSSRGSVRHSGKLQKITEIAYFGVQGRSLHSRSSFLIPLKPVKSFRYSKQQVTASLCLSATLFALDEPTAVK